MIFNNNYSHFLRDSKNRYYRFSVSQDNELIIDSIIAATTTQPVILTQNIVDYSVDIDKDDRIHILALNNFGDLCHTIYPLTNSEKRLTQINLKDNSMKFLTIKTIKDDVHIFYMLNNKCSNNWTIHHSYWHDNNWSTKIVTEVSSQMLLYPYMVDYSNNTIYLFYSKDSNYIYGIKKFNLDFLMWEDLDENIELPGSHNASFLINDKNIAFICFNGSINRNIYTIIKYRDLNSSNSLWSKDTLLSDHSVNALHPSLVAKNNYTYVLWAEGNNIVFKKTDSRLIYWNMKNTLAVTKSSVKNGIYISTHPSDCNFKNTFCPIVTGPPPYPIINVEKNTDKQSFIEKEPIHSIEFSNISTLANIISKEEYIRELQIILMEKDKKLADMINHKKEISLEVAILKQNLEAKELEITDIRQQLSSYNDAYLKFEKEQECKYTESLQDLYSEKYNSIKEFRTNLIEKDNAIERLNILVNSLYQENNSKDYQIEQLEEKLSRGLFKKIFR